MQGNSKNFPKFSHSNICNHTWTLVISFMLYWFILCLVSANQNKNKCCLLISINQRQIFYWNPLYGLIINYLYAPVIANCPCELFHLPCISLICILLLKVSQALMLLMMSAPEHQRKQLTAWLNTRFLWKNNFVHPTYILFHDIYFDILQDISVSKKAWIITLIV